MKPPPRWRVLWPGCLKATVLSSLRSVNVTFNECLCFLTSVVTCLKFSEIKSNWEDPETLKAFFFLTFKA